MAKVSENFKNLIQITKSKRRGVKNKNETENPKTQKPKPKPEKSQSAETRK